MKYINKAIKDLENYIKEIEPKEMDSISSPLLEIHNLLNNINLSLIAGEFLNKYFKSKKIELNDLINNELRNLLELKYQEYDLNANSKDVNYETNNYNIELLNDQFTMFFYQCSSILDDLFEIIEGTLKDKLNNKATYIYDYTKYIFIDIDERINNHLRILSLNCFSIYLDINFAFHSEIVYLLLVTKRDLKLLKESNKKYPIPDEIFQKLDIKISYLLKKIHLRVTKIKSDSNQLYNEVIVDFPNEIIEKNAIEYEETINKKYIFETDEFKKLYEYCNQHYDDTNINFNENSFTILFDKSNITRLHSNIKNTKDRHKQSSFKELRKILKNYEKENLEIKNSFEYIFNINYNYVFNNYISKRIEIELVENKSKRITSNLKKNIDPELLTEILEELTKETDELQKITKINNYFPYLKLQELCLKILKLTTFENNNKNIIEKVFNIYSNITNKFNYNLSWCKERNYSHFSELPSNTVFNDICIFSSYFVPISFDKERLIAKEYKEEIDKLHLEYRIKIENLKNQERIDNKINNFENKTIETVTIFTALIAILTGFLVNINSSENISIVNFFGISIILFIFVGLILFILNRKVILEEKLINKHNIFVIALGTIFNIILLIIAILYFKQIYCFLNNFIIKINYIF